MSKNQKRKDLDKGQMETEEGSERIILEKEAAVVLSQTEKLRKWNKEYTSEFTTITQIAAGKAPMVTESATTARRTLRNIRPLIVARHVAKTQKWQITTDVSFKIPHFVEGVNVVKVLGTQVTTETPLAIFEIVALDDSRIDTNLDEDSENSQRSTGETTRNSPRAFSPLIVKMPESTRLSSGMIWKPWRTVVEVSYSILADMGMSAELMATIVAHIASTGLLEGDDDLDARAYATDCERLYRSDESGCDSGDEDDEIDKMEGLQELEEDDGANDDQVEADSGGVSRPSSSGEKGMESDQEAVEGRENEEGPPLPP
ncbi:hypothetical protein CBR_g22142 [Chara braunii]|uniref:Uncharacterized protein n=1 Tax=Chara braunii TaxID=69332 RepID=A0A388L260_CHABU|nr:hypothetical protein CBR_g22142 [Chara braunii]|eukprot:GBG76395.1 hypothetical protein CBR_g22142 [Chara braunii]